MVRVVWEAQGIMDENIKKTMLVSVLQYCALRLYIKPSNDHPNLGIVKIQTVLNREFSKLKYRAQLIVGFKEIVMQLGEMPWELD